jgi:hypothetical protein
VAVDYDRDVVISIIDSLNDYVATKDFDFLFTMGSKLSFVAYTLENSDDGLKAVVPSLIKFTELIHRISQSESLIEKFDELIMAFLSDLKSWLQDYFLDDNHHLIASNVVESLCSNVESIQTLLEGKDELTDLDDIFF